MSPPPASVEQILEEAVGLASPDERRTFVERACGGDFELQRRVERLIENHFSAGSFLNGPAQGLLATHDQPAEAVGKLIGHYKLLEQIGEGGMGVVYVAEQMEPVRRRVALKIIKPGMDTKQVIARFEAERQALAMMDHPNIARVLDAGTMGVTSASGWWLEEQTTPTPALATSTSHSAARPYFVMELVRGLPITEYCDKARLDPRQRLALFANVCQAVQHAHQKGVIHRDLKPSNVMITVHDGRPVPKVIDFGVAKAVGQQLTERTVYTALTQLVGTPLYMSPEQADLSSQDVDTRSDVYSLGVLLYELLTGQTPFDKERLKNANFDEMRRIIREDEPPRPSHRISTLNAQASSTISQHRGLDERHLSRVLRGELDWIVMKALEKDRSRRYESASSLAADIQRYLSDEPVLACPPTIMYRFQKFARKHKPTLITTAAIAACLLLGTTVSAWQAVRATQAESQANASAEQAQEKAKEATEQRDEVRALNDRLQRTLYTAHVNLARHAWDEGSASQVVDLLEQHQPKPGEKDLRNFEWYYLYRLCNSELLTLKGHAQGVTSVAYSPDGKRLASGSNDKTIRIWDSQSGRPIHSLEGHTSGVHSVAFSPDGKRLASGAGDYDGERGERKVLPGEVKLWDSETGCALVTITGHAYPVRSVAFDPTGKRVAAAGGDYTNALEASELKVWDIATAQLIFDLKGHKGTVESVVFSPDGKRLATADWNGQTKVWDAGTGDLMYSTGGFGGLSFSPEGSRLATGGSIRDAQTGKPISSFSRRISRVNGRGMIYSPDGKRLADVAEHQPVRILDAETGEELFTLKRRTAVGDVAFSPDGTRLALANRDGTVTIADALHAPDDRIIGSHDSTVFDVAYTPDGKRLVSASHDKTIKVWDVQTGEKLLTIQEPKPVWSIAISPDGKRLASGTKVWDAATGEVLLKLPGEEGRGHGAVFSPDGKRLVAAGKIWDVQTGQELLTLGERRIAKAFSPDGNLIISSGQRPIKIFDARTGQELFSLKSSGIGGPGSSVVFSPDGKRLAAGSHNGALTIWDGKTGEVQLDLKGFSGGVNGVAFSPDGKRLAAQSIYRTLKVFDTETGQEMLSLKSGFGHAVAFSPDGHKIAASGDRCLKIWDATPLPEKQ